MSGGALAVVIVAVVIGSITKGVTGSGLPTVAIPVMAGFIGVEAAVVLMAFPTVVTNSWLLWEHRGHARNARHLKRMLVAGAAGSVAGVWLLTTLPGNVLSLALAVVIFGYAALKLWRPEVALPERAARLLSPPVGFAGGVAQGATGIAGPLTATYVHGFRLEPGAYVFTIAAQFQLFAAVQVATFVALGRYTGELVLGSLLSLIPVVLFLPVGIRLGRRLDRHRFERVVLVVLVVMGTKLLFDGLNG
ncbi:sulfite exporter TauE/SafE family protein [Egicoccus sp. AB-alg6-2]|uniref:sulfite exporter TauE/SafE family protein n=1 Tax=Egicoccus sp. AB-alg6-2 TaxID=3242692 RepID=UPI00359EFF5F